MVEEAPREGERPDGIRRALRLEYLTAAWNLLEAAVALVSGVAAGSVALVGFGLDSVIETVSAGILVWRLKAPGADGEAAEGRATRGVGITLFLLAAYILYEAGSKLYLREAPKDSSVGIVLAVASLGMMAWLRSAKLRVAGEIGSRALAADAAESAVCAWLSAALLAGLVLNGTLGWWWADPAAGLCMLPMIIREGWEAVTGSECGCACGSR